MYLFALAHNGRSNEAAMKYVILGAFSSGILLYGISLVYGLTGTTQLADIAGIPPTAGFIGKFYIFMSLIKTGYVSLAIIRIFFYKTARNPLSCKALQAKS